MNARRDEISPANLSESGRRHLKRICSGLGLQAAALTCDAAGSGLADSATVEQYVERTFRVLELAADLGVPVVTGDIGRATDPAGGGIDPTAVGALAAIATQADRVGVLFGVQTGADEPAVLDEVSRLVSAPSLMVCLDPGMLARFGHDPIQAAGTLAEEIVLAHVCDATRGGSERPGIDTALGRGSVDLRAFLAHLEAAGYARPYILRRRGAQRPRADLEADGKVLRGLIP